MVVPCQEHDLCILSLLTNSGKSSLLYKRNIIALQPYVNNNNNSTSTQPYSPLNLPINTCLSSQHVGMNDQTVGSTTHHDSYPLHVKKRLPKVLLKNDGTNRRTTTFRKLRHNSNCCTRESRLGATIPSS